MIDRIASVVVEWEETWDSVVEEEEMSKVTIDISQDTSVFLFLSMFLQMLCFIDLCLFSLQVIMMTMKKMTTAMEVDLVVAMEETEEVVVWAVAEEWEEWEWTTWEVEWDVEEDMEVAVAEWEVDVVAEMPMRVRLVIVFILEDFHLLQLIRTSLM